MRESTRALLARTAASVVPQRLRFRTAKLLYDYESRALQGVDSVVDYLGEPDLKFCLNTKEFIGWQIYFTGEYERDTNALLRRCVRAGDVVLEAGANNGSETVLLGRLVGPGGRVYAFEPVPRVARRLRVNVLLNDLDTTVELVPLALGEREAEVTFFLTAPDAVNQGMSSKASFAEAREALRVQQVTLDAWAGTKRLSRLDFLKMDIQGAELDLLAGGEKTLRRFRPLIFTEADAVAQGDCRRTPAELWRALRELDCDVFHGARGRWHLLADESELPSGNWFAVPHDHVLRAAFPRRCP